VTLLRPPRLVRAADTFGHETELRVRFGDTDAAGIVYYANYLRYFEAGRAELMRATGIPYAAMVEEEDVFMPVVDTWVRYHAPARYDDLIRVHSWVHEVRAATMLVGSEVWRDDTLLVSGAVRLGCVSSKGRPRRIPMRLRAFLRGEDAVPPQEADV
jgi:acyl-CoA thioester hydrolase